MNGDHIQELNILFVGAKHPKEVIDKQGSHDAE